MTPLRHCIGASALLGLLLLTAASACSVNSDSIGALGRDHFDASAGGAFAGAQAPGSGGSGGAIANGGASGGFAAGGALPDAGLPSSGGKSGSDASVERLISADGGSGGKGGTGGSGGAIDGGKADAPECVLTDVYCPWGYVLDDKGCQVCAPAPSGTGGAGGGDGRGADVPISSDAAGLSALCTSTGGHVNGSFCCSSVGDFPNSCLGGACGCSPTSSRTILTCTCPTGSCFTPASGCIPSTGPGPDAATTSDANGCTARPEGDGLCGGTRPPHYYACIMTMLPDPCVIQNLGDMTNGFCCP